jgi:hypothetical protein
MNKQYNILIKNIGYLQHINVLTHLLSFISCTTKKERSTQYSYGDAVDIAFNLNKKHNAIDYAVMVEVA